jgi:hypothetical protein
MVGRSSRRLRSLDPLCGEFPIEKEAWDFLPWLVASLLSLEPGLEPAPAWNLDKKVIAALNWPS